MGLSTLFLKAQGNCINSFLMMSVEALEGRLELAKILWEKKTQELPQYSEKR